jgi:hypothetical protein
MRHIITPMATALVLAAIGLQGADQTYEQRFAQEYARIGIGFVSDPSLVDTNNPGPALRNKPLPFSLLRTVGALAGIRLGMSMTEVVAAWGKPAGLFTRCGIGPLFTYGHTASLSFRGDRLVRLGLSDRLFAGVIFDNGFKSEVRRPQVEALLGADDTYLTNGIRLTVWYHGVSRTPTSAFIVDAVDGIAVRLDKEFSKTAGQQGPAPPPPRP